MRKSTALARHAQAFGSTHRSTEARRQRPAGAAALTLVLGLGAPAPANAAEPDLTRSCAGYASDGVRLAEWWTSFGSRATPAPSTATRKSRYGRASCRPSATSTRVRGLWASTGTASTGWRMTSSTRANRSNCSTYALSVPDGGRAHCRKWCEHPLRRQGGSHWQRRSGDARQAPLEARPLPGHRNQAKLRPRDRGRQGGPLGMFRKAAICVLNWREAPGFPPGPRPCRCSLAWAHRRQRARRGHLFWRLSHVPTKRQ